VLTQQFPYRKFLEITTMATCRVRCGYCPQDLLIGAGKPKSMPGAMSFETFRACIDGCTPDVTINFSGFVEPFTNRACRQMVRYAHDKGHTINVFTTNRGLTVADVDAISNIPFEKFSVHLPEEELRMTIRVDEDYLRVLEHITKASISNICFHSHSLNPDPRIKELLESTYAIGFIDLMDRAGNVDVGQEKQVEINGPVFCSRSIGFTKGVLMPNGDVQLCCMDFGLKHRIGNLLDRPYAWVHSDQNREYRALIAASMRGDKDLLCSHCYAALPAPRRIYLARLARTVVRNDPAFHCLRAAAHRVFRRFPVRRA